MNFAAVPTRPKAYSYLRFSTPEQMKGDSHRRQTALAARYAATHGLELDESTFQDLGVSAFKGDNAATGALRQFRNAVEDGLIPQGSFLLVESLDRLTRDHIVAAQSLLMSIISAGVSIATIRPGAERVYSVESLKQDGTNLIIAIVEMMRAHGESAMKSSRLKEVWQAKRTKLDKVNLTSIAPAWLQPKLARDGFDVIEDRADIVRGIFRDYLAGVGMETIATRLNKAEVKPWGRGAFWRRSYIAKILANPAVMGTFTPHTESRANGLTNRTPCEPVPGYFPEVIDADTFRSAQGMKQGGGAVVAARPRSGGVKFLLAGLAKCPVCGSSMTRVSKGNGAKAGPPYLICTRAKQGAGCVYKAVRVAQVDEAITRGASALLGQVPSGQTGLDAKWDALNHQQGDIDTAMGHLLDSLAKGGESRIIRERLDRMAVERDNITAALEALVNEISTSSSIFVAKALQELEAALAVDPTEIDIPKANAALRRVVKDVTVDYPSGELEFSWKQGGASRLTYGWPLDVPTK
jgi:DNA invertase Pin-like site-specific DNA recombinase